jgi:hypothetical protein
MLNLRLLNDVREVAGWLGSMLSSRPVASFGVSQRQPCFSRVAASVRQVELTHVVCLTGDIAAADRGWLNPQEEKDASRNRV